METEVGSFPTPLEREELKERYRRGRSPKKADD